MFRKSLPDLVTALMSSPSSTDRLLTGPADSPPLDNLKNPAHILQTI
jgi:hypothetical protein